MIYRFIAALILATIGTFESYNVTKNPLILVPLILMLLVGALIGMPFKD